jgi:hypothetical protein
VPLTFADNSPLAVAERPPQALTIYPIIYSMILSKHLRKATLHPVKKTASSHHQLPPRPAKDTVYLIPFKAWKYP